MAGLKINKKVAKETKICENISIKNDTRVGVDYSRGNEDTFSEITSSVDGGTAGNIGESIEEGVDGTKKGSKLKILVAGGVFLIVVAVGVVFVLGRGGVLDEDMLPQGDVIVDDVPKEEVKEELETVPEVEGPKKEAKVVYENAMLGLALKYPSNWYVEERADVLLNMVQSTSVEGKINLLEDEVKLAGVVLDFSARDELGTKISVGVSPLVLTGDTAVADIQSLSDVISVGTAIQIDEQITKNIEAGGGVLVESVPSLVKEIGDYKVIQSHYKFEKNGIQMEVIQMLVPYGVNNIVLTATSKVGENPINKNSVLVDMLGSMGRVGQVKLDIIDEVNGEPIKEEPVEDPKKEAGLPKVDGAN